VIDGFRILDGHVHSHLSGCADDPPGYTPEIVLRHAARLGIDGVGFCDHIFQLHAALPAELVAAMAGRGGLERVRALRDCLSRIDPAGLPTVSVGAEVEAWGDGLIPLTAGGRAELDRAVFSANHDEPAGVPRPASDRPEDVARHILRNTREAIESGMASSIGHPLLGLNWPRPREVYALYPKLGLDGLFEQARDAGVAFGFSRHLLSEHLAHHRDVRAVYRTAVRVGVKLAFETDCHRLWHMSCIVALVELARYVGLEPGDFIDEFPARG